jgi:hypothetical protein
MKRSQLRCLSVAAVFNLTSFVCGQVNPSSPQPEEVARRRTERSASRQRSSVTAMSESIAVQQRSVARQRRSPTANDFVTLQPARTLAPAASHVTPEEALIELPAGTLVVGWEPEFPLMQVLPAPENAGLDKRGFSDYLDSGGLSGFLKQVMDRFTGNVNPAVTSHRAVSAGIDVMTGEPAALPGGVDYFSQIISRLLTKPSPPTGETVEDLPHP